MTFKNGQIITDLYRKPTDRNQYLLPDSCHPPSCVENILYSLAMRIVRICSEPETRDVRFRELKGLLLDRAYREGMIDAAIEKARTVPRARALEYVTKTKSTARPAFVANFDPRLPDIQNILNKHWRSISGLDLYFSEVYPKPPLMSYRRQRNVKDHVIRAKVYQQRGLRPKRLKLV